MQNGERKRREGETTDIVCECEAVSYVKAVTNVHAH